jgi:hypothetical protein
MLVTLEVLSYSSKTYQQMVYMFWKYSKKMKGVVVMRKYHNVYGNHLPTSLTRFNRNKFLSALRNTMLA